MRRASPQPPERLAPAPGERPPEVPIAAPAEAVLRLQRTAGNAAVSGVLARNPPVETPPASRLAELDELLDKWNVPERKVLDLLRDMSAPDKATVAAKYRDKLADCLNFNEMREAVGYLPLPLAQKLAWLRAAAVWVRMIDYDEIKAIVTGAPEGQRTALASGWRDFFVTVCTNKTIVEAVNDLGFDLKTKLDWMVEEGTDTDTVAMVIRTTPADQLAPTAADTALMGRLRTALGSGFFLVQRMLTSDVLGEGTVENTYVGNTYETFTQLTRSGLTFYKGLEYTFLGGVTEAEKLRFRGEVMDGVARHLNGKWKLRIASPTGRQEGDGDYPIKFDVYERAGGYKIDVHKGNGRCATGEDSGEWYVDSMVGDTPDQRRAYYAHELGHGILGAPEEYAVDPGSTHDPGRTVTHDASVMGNFYEEADVTKVEIKDRHMKFLIPWATTFFPGRRVSIVR
jgi:hypothetical protein